MLFIWLVDLYFKYVCHFFLQKNQFIYARYIIKSKLQIICSSLMECGFQLVAANCSALPTASAGQYATSHCKPLLFWFPSKRWYINVRTFNLVVKISLAELYSTFLFNLTGSSFVQSCLGGFLIFNIIVIIIVIIIIIIINLFNVYCCFMQKIVFFSPLMI